MNWEPITDKHKTGDVWLLYSPKYDLAVEAKWNAEQPWKQKLGAWHVPYSMLMEPDDFTHAAKVERPEVEIAGNVVVA